MPLFIQSFIHALTDAGAGSNDNLLHRAPAEASGAAAAASSGDGEPELSPEDAMSDLLMCLGLEEQKTQMWVMHCSRSPACFDCCPESVTDMHGTDVWLCHLCSLTVKFCHHA